MYSGNESENGGNEVPIITPQAVDRVARLLCHIQGHDPDEQVGHGIAGSGAWHYSPRYRAMEAQVRDAMEMAAAINAVAANDG